MKIIIDTEYIVFVAKGKLAEVKAYIVSLYRKPAVPRQIEVRQHGLATGQVVPVRRPQRVQIKVKYIPSK